MQNQTRRIAELLMGIDRDDAHRSIGHFIFEFSRLEYALKDALATSLHLTAEQFDFLMPAADFAYTCSACRKSFNSYFASDETAREWSIKIVNEALAINADRVRVVHGLWLIADTTSVALHTSRVKLETGEFFKAKGELDNKAHKLTELRIDVSNLFNG